MTNDKVQTRCQYVLLVACAIVASMSASAVAGTRVDAGETLAIGDAASSSAMFPEAVLSKVTFWVDASRNLVRDGEGNLIAWLDARETAVADADAYAARVEAGTWAYPRAITYRSGEFQSGYPAVKDDVAAFDGKPYVDFGEFHENKWMLLVDASGARNRVSVRAFIGEIGFGNSAGFVLGDVDNPDVASVPGSVNGSINFHKGRGASGDDAVFSSTEGVGRYGETRIDGRIVDPTSAKHVRNGWELFTQNGPARVNDSANAVIPYVSTFFNAANFKESYYSGATDRQGGGKIAELIMFSNVLSEEEREAVEAYLRLKWGRSGTTGAVFAEKGATVDVDVSRLYSVKEISGAGDVVKSGTGTLSFARNGRLNAGTLTLGSGSVESCHKRNTHMALKAIGGAAVSVSETALSVTGSVESAAFAVGGDAAGRKVPLSGADASVKKIVAEKATLVIRPSALPQENVVAAGEPADFLAIGNLIANGGFESDIRENGKESKKVVPPADWEVAAMRNQGEDMGVSSGNTASSWITSNAGVPEGSQCLYVQITTQNSTNGIQQEVSVPVAGLYRFSVWIRSRDRKWGPNDATTLFSLVVDGQLEMMSRTDRSCAKVDTTFVQTISEFHFRKVTADLALSAGPHTLQLLASIPPLTGNANYDRALLLDDVRLEPLKKGEYVRVPDAGFNTFTKYPVNNNGYWYRNPDTPFWVFSSGAAGLNGGIARYASTWYWTGVDETADEDAVVAFLNRDGAITGRVAFPRSGRIRWSMRYALRSRTPETGVPRPGGQHLTMSLGGNQLFVKDVIRDEMTTAVGECDVTAGEQTLVIAVDDTTGDSDTGTLVDDIRFMYVADDSDGLGIVKGTDFAENAANQTWVVGEGVSFGSTAGGVREAVVTGSVAIAQTVQIPSNGVYMLSFQVRGMPLQTCGISGPYRKYDTYSHMLEAYLDGELLSNVYNDSSVRHPVEIRLPYLTAGAHELSFRGAATQENAACQSRISEPAITPLATESMTDWSGVAFSLRNGAKLEVDTHGTVRLGSLTVDGVSKKGIFSAADSEFVTGAGAVEVGRGFILIFR